MTTIRNDVLDVLWSLYNRKQKQMISYNDFSAEWTRKFGFHNLRTAERNLRKMAEENDFLKSDGEGNFMPFSKKRDNNG